MARKGKIKCSCCGEEKSAVRDYYSSSSDLYKDVGVFPYCKKCVEELYNRLILKYENDKKLAAKRLFIMLDIFYDEDLYNSCLIKGKRWLGEYMKIKANAKYKDKSSLDNINSDEPIEEKIPKKEKKKSLITEEMIDEWGEGYDEKEYLKLEKKYKKYNKNYPSKTLQQQQIIKAICELEVEKEKCRRSGLYSDYDKLHKQISAKMAELDVIPSKQKKYGEDKNMVYGNFIKIIEEEDPIPKPLPEFEDLDKFEYMLNRYFIKPFKKVFGLDKDIYTSEDEKNDNQDETS